MTTKFELFYDRIKLAAECTTDAELAKYLDLNKSTLSMWKKREKVDYELLFTKFEHENFDWLIKGIGERQAVDSNSADMVSPDQISIKKININIELDHLKEANDLLKQNNALLLYKVEQLEKKIAEK